MPENTTDTVWTVKRWHGAGTHAAGVITWENADALGHTGATSCPIRLPEGFTYGDGARIRVIVEVVHDEPAHSRSPGSIALYLPDESTHRSRPMSEHTLKFA